MTIALLAAVTSCAPERLVLTPLAALPSVCPLEGCDGHASTFSSASAPPGCGGGLSGPCDGASSSECTQRALSNWAEAHDERSVGCVGRTLDEACSLGDAPACAFAGRMWIEGRGRRSDAKRGIALIERACDAGVALSCAFGARWLSGAGAPRDGEMPDALDLRARFEAQHACLTGEAAACYGVGLLYYFGRGAFPRDRIKAAVAYGHGCQLGDPRACNNLGDALAYGEGFERDVVRSAATFEKACRLGEALGCANLGYMVEHGLGLAADVGRARTLYRDACFRGDAYACLHQAMLAAQGEGAPRDARRALAHWHNACERRDARGCAFEGLIYEDGAEGLARDEPKSMRAMDRACGLGEAHACEWVKARSNE